MSTSQLRASSADLFYEDLCRFVDFIRVRRPRDDPNVLEFKRLLSVVHSAVGTIPVIENVGWYFDQFRDEISGDQIQKLLDTDFTPFVTEMQRKPMFAKYAGMASALIPMMKETFVQLNPTDQNRFKLMVNALLLEYIKYTAGS